MPAGCRIIRITVFLSLVLVMSRSVCSAEDRAWPNLRAGYLPISANRTVLTKMRQAGLNAAWPKITNFNPIGADQNARKKIEQWADACEKEGLQLWPSFNFAGGDNELKFFPEFRREVTLAGIIHQHTPCPADERYWQRVVLPRCLMVAQMSRVRKNIAGVVLDLEMYGADHAGYGAACACESCRAGAGSDAPTALLNWQRQELTRICREVSSKVHQVNPKFQFAATHLEEPYPFFEGVALGLGTPEVPVVCAAERTYAEGYTPEVDQTQLRFRKLKAHVQYLGGMSLTHFSANQVGPQLYALGSHGSGFWLYTLGSLAAPNEQVPENYRVSDPQDDYWAAFRSASSELDHYAQSGGKYVSPLLSKLEKVDSRATTAKRVLIPVSHSVAKLPLPGEETHLRRYNISFVLLDQGETLRLTARGLLLTKQLTDGQVKVVDPEGREVLSRSVAMGKTEMIEFIAKSGGTYTVTTGFGQNACELRIANQRAVLFAGRHQRLKIHRNMRPMYFIVAEGQRPQVDIQTEDPSESVRVILRDPDGKVADDQILSGSQSISASGSSGIWTVVLEGVDDRPFGAVQIGLAPPLSPYLADAPERLLKDR
ncbi:MAG: hypothetical protein NT013_18750 [Planctomycetia bacterium]|nr:hypothetical protein [Planctomycetia bacterium]